MQEEVGRIAVRFYNEDDELEFTPAALHVDGKLGISKTIFGDDFRFLHGRVLGRPDRRALSPQCGFSSTVEGNLLSNDDEVAKLRLVVETAEEVWS